MKKPPFPAKTLLLVALLVPLAGAAPAKGSFKGWIQAAQNEKSPAKRLESLIYAVKSWTPEDGEEDLSATYQDIGLLCTTMGRHDLAIKYSNKSLKLEPDNGAAYLNRGFARLSLHAYDKAMLDFDKAGRLLDPPSRSERYALNLNYCVAYRIWGDRKSAGAFCDKAVRLRPKSHEPRGNRALLYAESGRADDAVKEYRKAFHLLKAGLSGADVTARSYARKMAADLHAGIGYAFFKKGNFKKAAKQYALALKGNPKSAWAHVRRAQLSASRGDLKAALESLDRAVELDKTFAEAYYERGTLRSRMKDRAGALKDFKKSIKIAPLPEAYYRRGVFHRDSGDTKKALRDFDRALKLLPGFPAAEKARETLRKGS